VALRFAGDVLLILLSGLAHVQPEWNSVSWLPHSRTLVWEIAHPGLLVLLLPGTIDTLVSAGVSLPRVGIAGTTGRSMLRGIHGCRYHYVPVQLDYSDI
jgi:hypothetical protein